MWLLWFSVFFVVLANLQIMDWICPNFAKHSELAIYMSWLISLVQKRFNILHIYLFQQVDTFLKIDTLFLNRYSLKNFYK